MVADTGQAPEMTVVLLTRASLPLVPPMLTESVVMSGVTGSATPTDVFCDASLTSR